MQLPWRAFGVLLLLAACLPQAVGSAPNPVKKPAASPDSFAGCYQLKLGRWWPWGLGEDTEFVTPPTRVRLLAERGTESWEKSGFLLRPLPSKKGTVDGRGGPAYRQILSGGRIALVWTDGFTGVRLDLRKHGKELRGWANPHFDMFRFVPHTAHVTARRITCPAKSQSRRNKEHPSDNGLAALRSAPYSRQL